MAFSAVFNYFNFPRPFSKMSTIFLTQNKIYWLFPDLEELFFLIRDTCTSCFCFSTLALALEFCLTRAWMRDCLDCWNKTNLLYRQRWRNLVDTSLSVKKKMKIRPYIVGLMSKTFAALALNTSTQSPQRTWNLLHVNTVTFIFSAFNIIVIHFGYPAVIFSVFIFSFSAVLNCYLQR